MTSHTPTQGETGGWQDISTAPRDGTRILVVCALASKEVSQSYTGMMAVDRYRPEMPGSGFGKFNDRFFPPTHWMPLPPPPSTSSMGA